MHNGCKCKEFLSRLIVEICSCFVNTHDRHYNCDAPRIHATAPLRYKILDSYGVHTAPVKFVEQKFRRSWCSHYFG